MSSRSSSEAASSLRLVKMSAMPREIAEDERDSPALRRDSQLRFAGAAGSVGGQTSRGGRGRGFAALEQAPQQAGLRLFLAGVAQPFSPLCLARAPRPWPSYDPMTPEETRARLLYRDGLMLVIDKPAGIAVHRGPKGGANLEDDFDALALRPAAQARARPSPGSRHRGLPGARASSQGAGKARPAVQAGQDRQDLLGDRRRRPRIRGGPDRLAARPARRHARLVDEGRRRRPARADALARERARPFGARRRSPGWNWSR